MDRVDCLTAGGSLISISRICDLIKLDFLIKEKIVCLHVQSALFRVLKANELLVSSNDMFLPSKNYKRKLFKKFKWDIPGNSLFDDQLLDVKGQILNKTVQSILFLGNDLIIEIGDDYKIEVLSCTMEKGREIFRVFKKGNIDCHTVIET